MACVVGHVGPDLTDLIDQPKSLTAWRLRYTTTHVRSLQSLAPRITTHFIADAMMLIQSSRLMAQEPLRDRNSMAPYLPRTTIIASGNVDWQLPQSACSVPYSFLLSNESTNPVYHWRMNVS